MAVLFFFFSSYSHLAKSNTLGRIGPGDIEGGRVGYFVGTVRNWKSRANKGRIMCVSCVLGGKKQAVPTGQ